MCAQKLIATRSIFIVGLRIVAGVRAHGHLGVSDVKEIAEGYRLRPPHDDPATHTQFHLTQRVVSWTLFLLILVANT